MSVMPVPFLKALAFTPGAALSISTHERPCASLPVTTLRMGLMPSAIYSFSFRCIGPARAAESLHANA
jgi:hypothetical protein